MILDLSSEDDEKFSLSWMEDLCKRIKSNHPLLIRLEVNVISVFDDYRDWFYTEEDRKNFSRRYVNIYSVHSFNNKIVYLGVNHDFPIYEHQKYCYVTFRTINKNNNEINNCLRTNHIQLNLVNSRKNFISSRTERIDGPDGYTQFKCTFGNFQFMS